MSNSLFLQEGEEGKEEEEKEALGKLEFSSDYNFTDNQVRNTTQRELNDRESMLSCRVSLNQYQMLGAAPYL